MNLNALPSTIPTVNNYLLTLVLKPGLEEKERKTLLDSMVKKVVGADGKVKKEDFWGERDFAYKLKKQTKGFYVHYEVETDPKNVKGLDKALKLEEDILRFLLVRV